MTPLAPPRYQNDASNWWHYSLNQWWGCEPLSPACANCYAETFDRFAGRHLDPDERTHWGKGVPRLFIGGFAEKIRKLNAVHALRPDWPRPRVFPNSMSDWLDPAVPVEWLWGLMSAIKDCKAMDHLLLTKRPELFESRLKAVWEAIPDARKSVDWWLDGAKPDNVWSGVTVENQPWADRRMEAGLKIGAAVNWLSIEPLLSEINLVNVGQPEGFEFNALQPQGISWVVVGGESGGKARPTDPRWVWSIRAQCRATATPFWFKQWGEWVAGRYNERTGKVLLEDGREWWVKTDRQRESLRFWDEREGDYHLVSARVGMNSVPLDKLNPELAARSNNHLLEGKIIRELPVPRRRGVAA